MQVLEVDLNLWVDRDNTRPSTPQVVLMVMLISLTYSPDLAEEVEMIAKVEAEVVRSRSYLPAL